MMKHDLRILQYLLFSLLCVLVFPLAGLAQVPDGLHYQAVIRENGNLVANQSAIVEFTIWETSTPIYRETQTVLTNAYGHLSAQLGTGTPSLGTFSNIDWTLSDHHLQVRINLGNGFEDLGMSELLSVPFAQHAGYASAPDFGLDALEDVASTAPSNGQVLAWNGTEWAPLTPSAGPVYVPGTGIAISGNVISNSAPDQTVSLSGGGATSVTGTYPNFIVSSTDLVNDADADPSNELQSLLLSGQNLSLSGGGGTVALPIGTTYTAGTGINITGSVISNTAPDQTVSLSGGGATSVTGTYPNFTVTSTDQVNDADADPANEIQSLSLNATTLSLSNGGGSVGLSGFLSPWTTSGSNIYRTSGNIGIGTTAPVVALQVYANRDILAGSSMSGNGAKLIWDYSSRAFRAGYSAASSWNEDSIGLYTAAFGFGSVALAYNSFAMGFYTHARTYAGFSIGRYNVGAAGSETSWTSTDPLFEVGNGSSNTNRNNAFTIRKDGRVGINDATPDYLLDIENPQLSMRSISINHDVTSRTSTMYGIYYNGDNSSSNSGTSYGTYLLLTNNNNGVNGIYSAAFCDASDGSPAYGIRSYVDNDNGSGWTYALYGSASGTTSGVKYGGYFNGDVYTNGSYLPSDERLKMGLKNAPSVMDKLMNLDIHQYTYNQRSFPHMNLPKGSRVGFLAQDVQQYMPELVKTSIQPAPTEEEIKDGFPGGEEVEFLAVDYAGMVPYLVKAIQEQQEMIDQQAKRIEALESTIQKMRQN